MDTPIVTAIITTVGLIIIELIKRPRPPLTPGSEPPPKSPIGNTKGGSSATRVLRVVLLLGLLGSGFVWTYQRIITDQSAPNISITKVPPAGIGGRDHIELIGGTVTGKDRRRPRCRVCICGWPMVCPTRYPVSFHIGDKPRVADFHAPGSAIRSATGRAGIHRTCCHPRASDWCDRAVGRASRRPVNSANCLKWRISLR